MSMNDLNWLVTRRLEDVERHEFSWVFRFNGDSKLTVECLWRLLERGRINLSSEDDGHQFGMPAPIDAKQCVCEKLAGAAILAVTLTTGTLDLVMEFDSGHVLQVIPNSSGYEAWTATDATRQFVAVGGGDLTVFGSED